MLRGLSSLRSFYLVTETHDSDVEPQSPLQSLTAEEVFNNAQPANPEGVLSEAETETYSDIEDTDELELRPHIELYDFNQATKDFLTYLDRPNRKSFPEIMAEMKLSPSEEKKFNKFNDPFLFVIVKTPVVLYERLYDLDSLKRVIKNNHIGKDFYRRPFTLTHIQPAFLILKEFDKTVAKIKAKRARLEAERLQAASKRKREEKYNEPNKKIHISNNTNSFFSPVENKAELTLTQQITASLRRLLPGR